MNILDLFSLHLHQSNNKSNINTANMIDENFKIKQLLLDKYKGTIVKAKGEINVSKERFIKMYFSCIDNLFNLTDSEIRVFMYACAFSSFNFDIEDKGNIFQNSKVFKEYCKAKGCDLSPRTIDNCVSSLSKKEYLIIIMKGFYIINPVYMLKGHMTDNMRYKVYFEITGKDPNGVINFTESDFNKTK